MESDYSDDDDYLPITTGAWGDQAQQTQHNSDNDENADYTTSHDPTIPDIDGWTGMIDPDAKKRTGAIGSGGLHRKGKNYKPISEEQIIKQRKGIPIPKSDKAKKTRASRSNNSKQPPPPPSNNRKFSRINNTNTSSTTYSKPKKQQHMPPVTSQPPPLSTIRRPPPPSSSSSGQSGWGALPLVETPFWEKKNTPPPPPPVQSTPPPPPITKSTNATTLPPNRVNNNNRNNWSTSTTNSNTIPGFDSRQPTTTIIPPPGFGPVPQRQYPVKSNTKSQPPPPPGYAYAEKSAWGTPTPRQPSDNHINPPPQPWATNDNDKELWKKMDEGMKMNEQSTKKNDTTKSNDDSDRSSGWLDKSLHQKQKSPPPPTTTTRPSHHTDNNSWGSKNGNWGTSPFINDKNNGWGNTTRPGYGVHDDDDDIDIKDTHQSPMQFLDQQMAGYTKSRFSDPRKSKYSSGPTENGKHLPRNYYTHNGTSRPAFMETPVKVALPPLSHNPVVIAIHLELDNGSKIPISIRKLDNPETLAQSFCQSQKITNPALINGIVNLFTQQKTTAMQRFNRS